MTRSLWKPAATTLAVALLAALSTTARADDYLNTLTIGTTTYSNVTVMTKTTTDIYFKHSFGFGNAKLHDVDRKTLLGLGYNLAPTEDETKSVFSQSAQSVLESSAVTNLVADPRFVEASALVTAQLGDFVEGWTPSVNYGIIAGFITFYLFFSFCCRQICAKTEKVGKKLMPLIWVPIFKQIPLVRAAGIPVWSLLPATLLFPIGWPVMAIWWAIKIAPARGKTWVVSVLLLLPFTNILAFLYLAFSGTGKSDATKSNVISLGAPPPRRAAA